MLFNLCEQKLGGISTKASTESSLWWEMLCQLQQQHGIDKVYAK